MTPALRTPATGGLARAGLAVVLLGVGLTLAATACARSPYPGAPQKVTTTTLDGRHQEIADLAEQIRQWRLDAHLDVEPAPERVSAMSDVAASAAAASCELPAPAAGSCRDVCELGGSICDNAIAICRIADELPGDGWARDKCDSAKGSCREAEERCCDCRRPDVGMP
jgi:hypothetical protein